MLFRFPKAALAIISLLFLTACETPVLEAVRKVTYPPEFNYISTEKLRGTMQKFALYSTQLDRSLRNNPEVSEQQRESAIEILRKMERLSYEIGSEALSSSHNIVSLNIDKFRRNIIEARKGLEENPPNYYRVGAIPAYCLNCHALAK